MENKAQNVYTRSVFSIVNYCQSFNWGSLQIVIKEEKWTQKNKEKEAKEAKETLKFS